MPKAVCVYYSFGTLTAINILVVKYTLIVMKFEKFRLFGIRGIHPRPL